jgi:hypothetical protein
MPFPSPPFISGRHYFRQSTRLFKASARRFTARLLRIKRGGIHIAYAHSRSIFWPLTWRVQVFGKDAYVSVIRSFLRHGFTFEKFLSTKKQKAVHVRHDIDFSVKDAHQLALVESELGVATTYFFMLTSNTYNLLSKANRSLVKEIQALGHDVTLHFDPLAHPDIDAGFAAEKLIFEEAFGAELKIVSLHRPGVFLEHNNRQLAGCRHTYEDSFVKDMTYLSDSAGRDIQHKLLELAQQGSDSPLHLLLHPIWWTSKTSSPTATLNGWLDRNQDFLVDETRRNCRTFECQK